MSKIPPLVNTDHVYGCPITEVLYKSIMQFSSFGSNPFKVFSCSKREKEVKGGGSGGGVKDFFVMA